MKRKPQHLIKCVKRHIALLILHFVMASYFFTKMDKQEIYSYLCYYDKRNPNNYLDEMTDDEIEAAQKDCSCDNCFYGRTKLANELLKYVDA